MHRAFVWDRRGRHVGGQGRWREGDAFVRGRDNAFLYLSTLHRIGQFGWGAAREATTGDRGMYRHRKRDALGKKASSYPSRRDEIVPGVNLQLVSRQAVDVGVVFPSPVSVLSPETPQQQRAHLFRVQRAERTRAIEPHSRNGTLYWFRVAGWHEKISIRWHQLSLMVARPAGLP